MKHNLAALTLSLWMVAGCQTQTVEPPINPPVAKPAPVKNPAPATQAGVAKPAEPSADTRADSAAKLAAVHAAEIEAMASSKRPAQSGVTPIDPVAQGQPSQQPSAAQPGKTEGGFKPIPVLTKDIAAEIAAHVSLGPPGVQPSQPNPSAVTEMPAETPAAQSVAPSPNGPSPVAPPPAVVMTDASPMPSIAPPAVPEIAPQANVADPLEARLQKAAKEAPNDLAVQLDAQIYKFLKNDPVPSSDAMAGLQGEDRDVLTALMDGLSNFRNAIRKDNNLLISRKIRPLTEMADRLRARSDLTISNPAICNSIRGWGVYEAITPLRLTAGVDQSPGLYYEIENFSSRLNDKNLWETKMRQDVAIYDDRGGLVWQWPNEAVMDVCRNRRHDFFFAKRVPKPIRLPQGNYIMKISLTDAGAGRVAETSLSVQMVAPANAKAPVQGPPR